MATTVAAAFRSLSVKQSLVDFIEQDIDTKLADVRWRTDKNLGTQADMLAYSFRYNHCLSNAEIDAIAAIYSTWNVQVSCDLDQGLSEVLLSAIGLDNLDFTLPGAPTPAPDTTQDLLALVMDSFDLALAPAPPTPPPPTPPAPLPSPPVPGPPSSPGPTGDPLVIVDPEAITGSRDGWFYVQLDHAVDAQTPVLVSYELIDGEFSDIEYVTVSGVNLGDTGIQTSMYVTQDSDGLSVESRTGAGPLSLTYDVIVSDHPGNNYINSGVQRMRITHQILPPSLGLMQPSDTSAGRLLYHEGLFDRITTINTAITAQLELVSGNLDDVDYFAFNGISIPRSVWLTGFDSTIYSHNELYSARVRSDHSDNPVVVDLVMNNKAGTVGELPGEGLRVRLAINTL